MGVDGVDGCRGEIGGVGDGDGETKVEVRADVEGVGGVDVAITRKVVRSNRTTSVALHTAARVVKCFESTEAFGISVCTICDHAYNRSTEHEVMN